jgi:hypothetical protein
MKTAEKQKEEPLEAGPRIARKLDLDPATIRRWAREGAPHHVLGDKLVRYRLNELLAWRAGRQRQSPKSVEATETPAAA